MAVTRGAQNLIFPAEVSSEIWADALHDSLAMSLGSQVRMPAAGGEIQTITGEPVADWVAEGERKPVGEHTFGKRTFKPYKAAVVESFSDEFKRDKAALYAMLRPRLSNALVTLFDNAVLHGVNVPGTGFDTLQNAPTAVWDGSYTSSVNVLEAVARAKGSISSWVFGIGGEVALLRAADTTGRPLFLSNPSTDGSIGSLLGRPVRQHERAERLSTTAADTVGLVGPWNEIMWGYVDTIKYEEYDGPIYNGSTLVHAGRQDNMSSLIVEFEVGCLIRDTNHFRRLVQGTGTTPETPDTP